jgi:hypothetical protein
MFLLIALSLDILAAGYGFKTARANGKSGLVWAALIMLIGLSLQFVIPFLIVLVLASMSTVQGTTDLALAASNTGRLGGLFSILGLMISIMAMILTLQFAATDRGSSEPVQASPPERPRFRSGDY